MPDPASMPRRKNIGNILAACLLAAAIFLLQGIILVSRGKIQGGDLLNDWIAAAFGVLVWGAFFMGQRWRALFIRERWQVLPTGKERRPPWDPPEFLKFRRLFFLLWAAVLLFFIGQDAGLRGPAHDAVFRAAVLSLEVYVMLALVLGAVETYAAYTMLKALGRPMWLTVLGLGLLWIVLASLGISWGTEILGMLPTAGEAPYEPDLLYHTLMFIVVTSLIIWAVTVGSPRRSPSGVSE